MPMHWATMRPRELAISEGKDFDTAVSFAEAPVTTRVTGQEVLPTLNVRSAQRRVRVGIVPVAGHAG